MDSSPPRYEDLVYVTNGNLHRQDAAPMTAPPQVHRPTVQPTVQPAVQPTVQPTFLPPIVLTPAMLSHTIQEVGSSRAFLNFINTLTHFFLGAIVFSAFAIASNGPISGNSEYYYDSHVSFSQHIYLCVTGYLILLSQAVLSFSPHGGWAHGLKHPQNQLVYGVMQILGSSLALAGCFVKITNNYDYPISNYGHAVTGWMVMLLTLFSLIGGIINFVHSETISQGPYKNAHAYLFIMTLTMAFICLSIAFGDRRRYFSSLLAPNLSIIFTVFAMAGVLFAAKYRIK